LPSIDLIRFHFETLCIVVLIRSDENFEVCIRILAVQ